jgi:hypothetical protein
MKGVAVALMVALLACATVALANNPLAEPEQFEAFCEHQLVSGTGIVDVSTSIVDKKLALEYYNVMAGDGDFEMDSTHKLSENPTKSGGRINTSIPSINESADSYTNLLENTKLTYDGEVPLTGGKFINSKAFYGGIGANIQEMFSVYEMEKDQTSFLSSTNSANGTHAVGITTMNAFNGTWGTDANWHKIFYKDIKAHEMFSGDFEVQKEIKFHENATGPAKDYFKSIGCSGIDC